jgi:hypothetical protein
LPPSSRSKNKPFHLISRSFLARLIFVTLKMEAIYSSETSVDSRRTDYTARYIPEDSVVGLFNEAVSSSPILGSSGSSIDVGSVG